MLKSDLSASEGGQEGARAKKAWTTPTIEDSSIGGGTEGKAGTHTEFASPVGTSAKAGS
jgi:hypothetical protein